MSLSSFHPGVSVHYKCGCGELCDISFLYLCQLCNKLNCCYCVTHQIDQYFCRNCMETSVWTDIRKHKFLCRNCFTCPRCFHILNTVTLYNHNNLDKNQVFYSLLCLHCRWSTREVGLQDCSLVNDFLHTDLRWTDYTISLVDMYKNKSELELLENVGGTFTSTNFHISNRNTLDYNIKKNAISHTSFHNERDKSQIQLFSKYNESCKLFPTEDDSLYSNVQYPIGIDNTFYNEIFVSNETTSLNQRLNQPLFQYVLPLKMTPNRLKIYSKRFKRCRYCQHILCRPDLNVAAIRFKILHIASLFVPIVRVISFPTFEFGETFTLPIVISNPSLDGITLQIIPNESLSSLKFQTPPENIELSGKEVDHNLEVTFAQNTNCDRLISSVSGHSVHLLFEVNSTVSKISQLHFSIVYSFNKIQDQLDTSPKHNIPSDFSTTSLPIRITLKHFTKYAQIRTHTYC